MVKKKISISITIDESLVTWLDSEAKTQRFRNRSHGIEVAVILLKKQTENTEKAV